MSIWISDPKRIKVILICLAVMGLSACGGRNAYTSAAKTQKSTIQVGGQTMVIAGPPGFCVDQSVSQIDATSAFVLLGNCGVVAPKSRGPSPKIKALLTATVSPSPTRTDPVAQSAEAMDRFFRSEDGRTALSRSSDPGTVNILDTFENDGAYFLRVTDSSPGIVPNASPDYWRSYFGLKGQIVSVSVIGFQSKPLAPATGLDTVREFTRTLRANNSAAAPVGTTIPPTVSVRKPSPPRIAPATTRSKPGRILKRVGILRRLLG